MIDKSKIFTLIVGILILISAVFAYFKFYFVVKEEVKSGELIELVCKKGWIWKTYEGRLIRTDAPDSTATPLKEFNFSVLDKSIAEELMKCSGNKVELHYKEYKGALPWRGMEKIIVDKLVSVKPVKGEIKELSSSVD